MEDFILSTQILTEFDFVKPKDYKVRAIIFLNTCKKIENLFDVKILNKQIKNWVLDAVNPYETTFVSLGANDDPFEKAKQNIKDEDYTIVLFADTPIVKNNTILEVLDYAQTKDLDFCKLPRGFIVKSKNFVKDNILLSAEASFVNAQEFFTIFDQSSLCRAREILQNRILDMHLKNGATIENKSTITIDCDVTIGKNVVIKQNNAILCNSIIKDGVVLEEFNLIKNSVINENCNLKFCYIENSIIKKNTALQPFTKVINNKEKN